MTVEIIIKRLSIIKYLFETGVTQTKQPEIISYTALLSFHDSIDMFMGLAAEKKGIQNRRNLYLMQHFDAIPELTLKPSVNKINERRNTLKHNGQIPAKIEIEESKTIASLFFEQNTPIIFGLQFEDVSIFNLISFDRVKAWLVTANEFCKAGDYKDCVESVAKAYYELLTV